MAGLYEGGNEPAGSLKVITIRSNNKLSQWRPIYSGVRQGCGLSPLLFIIYINRIIQDWRQTRHGFIPINRNLQLDALLFADDLVLMASTEDDLQYSVHNLNKVSEKYNMEINIEKSKIMSFCGKFPVPSKICLNNKIIERVNTFTYLGYTLSPYDEVDIAEKICKYNKTMGIINKIMKPSLVQRHTRIGLYKTLAQPVLSYGSEAWTVKNKDVSRITASVMWFMRATAGYTRWDHKKNEDLMQELQIEPIMQFISKYQLQWEGHLERMNRCKIPKALLHYHPYGKRSLGRPKKRWTENSSLRP
ncbi:hypothetical protein ANN_20067 [Periplaneta americana]|uniref:Reverse transcriptase domain-containing protein n=1 Tax=Periplaneta americana TaxID=6978 RepID=A0ABQ8SBM4_PERAM|nr:hypothetical protein ANN_20067 [Periplaneta americana]